MIILSIETSCDETAISLIDGRKESNASPISFTVLADITLSQIELHKQYGGVFPAMAKREHSKNLIPILKQALIDSGMETPSKEQHSNILQNVRMLLEREPELCEQFLEYIPTIEKPSIDAIAVTIGPGLEPTLWVGINFAKALSAVWNIPIIPINHLEGHIFSALLSRKALSIPDSQFPKQENSYTVQTPKFPALSLLISGGHTEIVLIKDWFTYEVLGRTKDDAVGEAYDKVARLLDLEYPGGPKLAALAKAARKENLEEIIFPRPMINSGNLNFSFSGLKTSVLYTVRKMSEMKEIDKKKIALGFENAATEVLREKMKKAIEETGATSVLLGGGVAANTHIRGVLEETATQNDAALLTPPSSYTTDNALMIGVAGLCRALLKADGMVEPRTVRAKGTLEL